jgi:glycylpeptide N-tetradecanoyltransferase
MGFEGEGARHQFWGTQPVGGRRESREAQEAFLPEGMYFREISVERDLSAVYEMLRDNYVEDDLSLFRLEYSREFLAWQMQVPGSRPEWNVGLFRGGAEPTLIGFISALHIDVSIDGECPGSVVVNFLCLRKMYREKRTAPLLIKEIRRRVNERGIYKALFTAGEVFPFKYTESKYMHRIINPKKLIEKCFCTREDVERIEPSRNIRRLRRARGEEMEELHELYKRKYFRMRMHQALTLEQFRYLVEPREGIVEALVPDAEGPPGEFISFFRLRSRVLAANPGYGGNDDYIETFYLYYYNGGAHPRRIVADGIKYMEERGDVDVLNCLEIEENEKEEMERLGFIEGDGTLRYYLFNWNPQEVSERENGVIPF